MRGEILCNYTCQSLEDVHLVLFLQRPLTSDATLEWSVAFLVAFHTELPAADDLLADDGVPGPLDLESPPLTHPHIVA